MQKKQAEAGAFTGAIRNLWDKFTCACSEIHLNTQLACISHSLYSQPRTEHIKCGRWYFTEAGLDLKAHRHFSKEGRKERSFSWRTLPSCAQLHLLSARHDCER